MVLEAGTSVGITGIERNRASAWFKYQQLFSTHCHTDRMRNTGFRGHVGRANTVVLCRYKRFNPLLYACKRDIFPIPLANQ